MKLTGLHLLLTYQCNYECDHCFVWGSPWHSGTMTMGNIREILRQAKDLGTIEWIYFEGGEPFLYYPVLVRGVKESVQQGYKVGIVSNSYWATAEEDALEWLTPFEGLIEDLSISCDLFHGGEALLQQEKNACAAAEKLKIPVGVIRIAQPELSDIDPSFGTLPPGESAVMYRGRAAVKLVSQAVWQPWTDFTECPHEDLKEPGRVHLDPLGYLHVCQGISLGNIFQTSLKEVCLAYYPETHPIVAPLLEGGPAELVRHYDLPHGEKYADACHLCYETRLTLRDQFPEILTPDQMYGVDKDE